MISSHFRKASIYLITFGICLTSLSAQTLSGVNMNSPTLETLNLINVTVGGDFPFAGTYPASRTERVDQLITRLMLDYKAELMKTTPDENLLNLLVSKSSEVALRNIILKKFNGETINVDLVKFRLTGDFTYNPYLNNEDVIIFPTYNLDNNFVYIAGAVNKEIKFEYVEGEKLSDAIQIARGINSAYENVNQAEFSRLGNDGSTYEEFIIDIRDNTLLKRGDRIRILADENKRRDYSVLVLGEVKYPGKIFISKNNTTLRGVINKAGGFTKEASVKFAELIRDYDSYSALRKKAYEDLYYQNEGNIDSKEILSEFRTIEYLKMFRAADLVIADTLFFNIDNQLRSLDGHSSLDFRKLDSDSSFESNYTMNDGDIIIVPQKRDDIYVWGGVRQIGYYEFQKNYSIWDYINQAGGLTGIAYGEDEIYLIKGKSRDWINIENTEKLSIEPGDFIYVKKEVPRDTGFYIYRVAAYAGIIGSVATVILLLTQIGK